MNKPRLLDLFSGAGGAAVGYHRAGFEVVVGIDNKPQKNYPFLFVQMDALEALRILIDGGYIVDNKGNKWYLSDFDVIHASPPCQAYTNLRHLGIARNGSYLDSHPRLIKPLQELLDGMDKPYVIENVTGARRQLRNPVMLCGKHFGLKTYRHRWFETKPFMLAPSHGPHKDQTPSAGHGISPKGFISIAGNGGVKGLKGRSIVEYWSLAMGIDWMTRPELAEAIPPAYTEFIGLRIMEGLPQQESGVNDAA